MRNLKCWLTGCEKHPQDYDPEHAECVRCGGIVSYSDMVGDTRYNRIKEWCNYWLFRKWIPAKCWSCGRRYKCDESDEHIPF